MSNAPDEEGNQPQPPEVDVQVIPGVQDPEPAEGGEAEPAPTDNRPQEEEPARFEKYEAE